MKRLVTLLLAGALFLNPVSQAANSATNNGFLPIKIGTGWVESVSVSIDTTGQDLTIKTPKSGNMICLAGMLSSETNASNVTFKSGSTTLVALELAANQGLGFTMGKGGLLCTYPGQALIIQSSAVYSSMLLNIVETERIDDGMSF